MAVPPNSFEHFQKKLLIDVIADNPKGLEITLNILEELWDKEQLEHILLEEQHFPSLGLDYDKVLLGALRMLMQDHHPDLRAEHFQNPQAMLKAYLSAYQGLPIHIAAVLQRGQVISQMLWAAVRNDLGCSKLLTKKDACGNTFLYSSILRYNEQLKHFVNVQGECSEFTVQAVLRHCIMQASRRQLIFKGGWHTHDITHMLSSLQKLIDCEWDKECSVNLFYYIRTAQSLPVGNIICGLSLYKCVLQDPSPFHFAVAIYGKEGIDEDKATILKMLHSSRSQNGWMEENEISTLKIEGKTQWNGTAAHFALLNYQPSHLQQIHPGFAAKNHTPELSRAPADDSDDANTYVKMLEHLRDFYNMDLMKANHDQKTPLDYLPPDADPSVIQVFDFK